MFVAQRSLVFLFGFLTRFGVDHFNAADVLACLLQEGAKDQTRVRGAEAEVWAEAESEVWIGFPVQADFVRGLESVFVEVR